MTHIKPATIIAPRITEKATSVMASNNVYVFNITPSATKTSIAREIKEAYKVTPVRVNIVNNKPRNVFRRGKRGVEKAVRKAYVYLKKGDSIAIM